MSAIVDSGDLPADESRALAVQAVGATVLTVAHSLRARGLGRTLLFGALGIALPVAGEYTGINLMRLLRHRTRPQWRGVPLNATLGWYNIGYATFALVESLAPLDLPPRRRQWMLPAATAAVATSLDLILDCYGLDSGLWEWNSDGLYAPGIHGANGRHGIPLNNFMSWILLTGGVTWLYLRLSQETGVSQPPAGAAGSSRAGRTAALLLLPYYLHALAWAIRQRQVRPIIYSLLLPLALIRAVRGR